MDLGLNSQQRQILGWARAKNLRSAQRWQIQPPLWAIALASLVPLLLLSHPARYLVLITIPPVGLWSRQRLERRFSEWVLDLRER